MAPRSRPTSVRLAVAQFALAGLAAFLVVGVAAALLLRHAGTRQAIDQAKRLSALAGHGIVEPALRPGLLRGEPSALRALDRIVRRRVLHDPIVRVKLWRADGTIVYSDEPRLIGSRYPLDEDELASLRDGSPAADVSDLSRPENRFEQRQRKLLEVYLPVHAGDGTPLLFETYQRFGSVTESARAMWRSFLPVLILALVALWVLQLPLAVRLGRRLRRGQDERERLLQHALAASQLERRRIAADLHDGPVQDLAGVAFSLAAAERQDVEHPERGPALRAAARETRRTIRQLRALLVDLYPPNLHSAGLPAALRDLASPLGRHGIDVELDLEDGLELDRGTESLLFRVAQEALRNVVRHAGATRVVVRLHGRDGSVVLSVEDDGRGFDPGRTKDSADGHVGLALVADLARDAGAQLEVRSRPHAGTSVTLSAPGP